MDIGPASKKRRLDLPPQPPQPQSGNQPDVQMLQAALADREARIAEAAKQLQDAEQQLALLSSPGLVDRGIHQATILSAVAAALLAIRELLTHGAATPAFPLLKLPNEVCSRVCHLSDAAPALRLTCKALCACIPSLHLRPIQSPDQTDAAFFAALTRPSRLRPLTSLDLTQLPDMFAVTSSSLGSAVATHSTALHSIALDSKLPLSVVPRTTSLHTLLLEAGIIKASNLAPLASLPMLQTLRLDATLGVFGYRNLLHEAGLSPTDSEDDDVEDEQQGTARILSMVLSLRGLTHLELNLHHQTDMAALTPACLQPICAALPALSHLSLLPAMPWDSPSLSHLAALSALTALGIGHNSPDARSHVNVLHTLAAAAPHLAALTLLTTADSLPALPLLFCPTRPSPAPLSSFTLDLTDHGMHAFAQVAFRLLLGASTASNLTRLSISGHFHASRDEFLHLSRATPALRSLTLSGFLSIPTHAFSQLATLQQLTGLSILKTLDTDEVVASHISRLHRLEALAYDGVPAGLLAGVRLLTSLTILELHSSAAEALEELQHLSRLTRLRTLRFSGRAAEHEHATEDPRFYSALMQLPALRHCWHASWGADKACSADDIRRRFAWKNIPA